MRRVFQNQDREDLFRRDGLVVVRLLDDTDVLELLEFYSQSVPGLAQGFHATMFSPDVAYRTAVDERLRSILTPRLEPLLVDYRAVVGNFVVKEHGRSDSAVPVHQDWTFVDEPEMYSLNVWCPLIDTTAENGRLHVFKGSHDLVPVLRGPFFPNPFVELAPVINRRHLTELPLRAGEAAIYSHSLVHASPPNRSATTRVAANLTLVPSEAQIIHCWLDRSQRPQIPEIFRVDDDFFLSNVIGQRPAAGTSLGRIGRPIPFVTQAELFEWAARRGDLASQRA